MNARISLLIPLLLLSAVLGRAQEAAPDFSAGFKQLAALGLPALDAQAKWSAFPEAASTNYELRELVKSVKGNAWLLPSPDAKLRALALGGTEVIELKSTKKRPSDPDLTKDAGSLVAALKKLAAKRDPDDSFSYRSGGSNFGSLLLFATQLYQTGHPDLANQLALAVFELFPSREAALDSAIDLIADPLYQKASAAFFSSGAWAVYHQTLVDLGKRFPRGWASRDAVALFLPQLEKQAGGTTAPAPALPDATIDPRALEIIRELTDKPPAAPEQPNTKDKNTRGLPSEFELRLRMQMMGEYDGGQDGPSSLWLLDDSAAAAKPASPLARLRALKMAALPVLAALAEDPFLTHLPNARSYSGGYFSSSEGSEERTLRIYESLKRPATRGEIATQLLAATLPDPQNELRQADPDSLRDLALAFWKEHQSATREELAAVFLREGSPSQASQAASILAASADPKAHQTFEAHVLAADPAIATFQDVRSYLRARKAAARSFFDAYAKLVRSQSRDSAGDDEESNPNAWAVKEAGGAAKILKQLEALVGGQTPRALAVQIAKGKPADAAAAIKSLSSLLADATPTKHLHALLEGANTATDATVRAHFLTATFNIGWNQEEAGEEPAEDTPPVTRKFSEPEAAVWRKLLADTRELPKEFNCYGVNMSTVDDLAATAFENSVSRSSDSFSHASAILNKPASAILMEQATARLAGKPIPPLPDASKVSAERLTEIVAAAGSKLSAEVHPYLSSLTPDERAAWVKWFNDPGDLAYPDSLKALQFTIVARTSDNRMGYPDVKGAGSIDIGFKITPDSLTEHIEALAADIDRHSRTSIRISSAYSGPGLEVFASVAPLPAHETESDPAQEEIENAGNPFAGYEYAQLFMQAIQILEANEAAAAAAVVSLQGEDFRSQAVWLIQDGKATLQPSGEQDDDAKDPFAASLKTLLESKERQQFQIEIQILTRADAKKFKAESEDPASSDGILPPLDP